MTIIWPFFAIVIVGCVLAFVFIGMKASEAEGQGHEETINEKISTGTGKKESLRDASGSTAEVAQSRL